MKLIEAIEEGSLSPEQIKEKVSLLLTNELSARGFMAALSVSESIEKLQGASLEGLLDGLKAQPEVAYDLLVKNIIMSSSAALSHEEKGNIEQKKNSQDVTVRCLHLAEKINDKRLSVKVEEVLNAINAFNQDPEEKHDSHHLWFKFFERWGYQDRHLESSRPHLEKLLKA